MTELRVQQVLSWVLAAFVILAAATFGSGAMAQPGPAGAVKAAGALSHVTAMTGGAASNLTKAPPVQSPGANGVMGWLTPLVAMLAAGLLAGFAAGIFGIGGGFIVVPALFIVLPLLGGDHAQYAHIAIGTSAATIIVTSIRSVRSHAKRGAVDFEVLKSWAPWIVLGDGVGVLLAGHVDGKVLTLIFAGGVMLMSINFLVPKLGDRVLTDHMPSGAMRVGIAGGLGAFSSLLGIGGGTIAIMVMTLCGRSIHKAVATKQYVASWRRRGVRVMAWTVNDPLEKAYCRQVLGIPCLTDTLEKVKPDQWLLHDLGY